MGIIYLGVCGDLVKIGFTEKGTGTARLATYSRKTTGPYSGYKWNHVRDYYFRFADLVESELKKRFKKYRIPDTEMFQMTVEEVEEALNHSEAFILRDYDYFLGKWLSITDELKAIAEKFLSEKAALNELEAYYYPWRGDRKAPSKKSINSAKLRIITAKAAFINESENIYRLEKLDRLIETSKLIAGGL